jgi:hypothetical protein
MVATTSHYNKCNMTCCTTGGCDECDYANISMYGYCASENESISKEEFKQKQKQIFDKPEQFKIPEFVIPVKPINKRLSLLMNRHSY